MRGSNIMLAVLLFSGLNCSDLGETPPLPKLAASSLSVTLAPGGQTTVVISGGNPPYTISRQPDALLATAVLANNAGGTGSLLLQANSSNRFGTTTVKVKDADAHESGIDTPQHDESEIEIAITVVGTLVSFSAGVQPIFNNNCTSCHGGNGGLFLTSGQSYANLVNVQAQAGCTSQKRVQPGDAAVSVLYKRVSGSECGNQMPKGGTPLPASEIAKIRDWINQGAQNN